MWQCQTCGNNVAETDTYCSECGVMIRKRNCPHCGFSLAPVSESCPKCGADAVETGRFTDERDGQVYRTVKIGNQIWMAENLNYGKMTTNAKMSVGEKWCYNNDETMCSGGRGGFYSKDVAVESCPLGWHLPSNEEWNELFKTVGGVEIAGIMLKSRIGWQPFWSHNHVANGADVYGFSAIPTGDVFLHELRHDDVRVEFGLLKRGCGFWSSDHGLDNYGHKTSHSVSFYEGSEILIHSDSYGIGRHGYGIRCLKNQL